MTFSLLVDHLDRYIGKQFFLCAFVYPVTIDQSNCNWKFEVLAAVLLNIQAPGMILCCLVVPDISKDEHTFVFRDKQFKKMMAL
jgi:hypothetical protein